MARIDSQPPISPCRLEAAREKTVLSLLGSLAFVAIGAFMIRDAKAEVRIEGWGCLVFFGLCGAVFLWLLARPQILLLDPEGFTLAGGLTREPRRIPWRDVKGFFVYRLPRGGTMVGFDFAPGAAAAGQLSRFNRTFGAEGALPKGWRLSVKDMVDLLNDYRARALRE